MQLGLGEATYSIGCLYEFGIGIEVNKQDAIDKVITHPLLGLPIFAAVMFLVFQISQAWLGPWIADGFEFLVLLQRNPLRHLIGIGAKNILFQSIPQRIKLLDPWLVCQFGNDGIH